VSKTNWSSLQKIWEDANFILSRETAPGGSEPRLILAPTSERPSPDNIRRLEYLHSLRARLDSAWFARPISVVWQNGLPALLSEDQGGTVLEQRLGRPLKLQLALRLGIGVASALGRFHASGFIHRALNPNGEKPGSSYLKARFRKDTVWKSELLEQELSHKRSQNGH
jgi:hypothetical protein